MVKLARSKKYCVLLAVMCKWWLASWSGPWHCMDKIKTGYRKSSTWMQAGVTCGRAVLIYWATNWFGGSIWCCLLYRIVLLMTCCLCTAEYEWGPTVNIE